MMTERLPVGTRHATWLRIIPESFSGPRERLRSAFRRTLTEFFLKTRNQGIFLIIVTCFRLFDV